MRHTAGVMVAGVTCMVLAGVPATAEAAKKKPQTWYVKAGSGSDGRGSARAPFRRLASVERASRAGDRIVVLPGPGALDGGLALKRRQRLRGSGPSVLRERAPRSAPRLTNTGAHLDGDAVRLAPGASVRNLRIEGARRGAVYGSETPGVIVAGNVISGQNASCTRGFQIPPFKVPTLVGGVGVPISEGLSNGWAGIMLDMARSSGRARISHNRVGGADCGDGIDVRLSGTARLQVRVLGNDVRDLREGEDLQSVLAIGLQTRDRSVMDAHVNDNRQSGLGNDEDSGFVQGADSEGVFVNPVGPSRLTAFIQRNRYVHTPGRGGFSANGMEFVSMGDGAKGIVDIRDSSFTGTPGDVLEQLALGTGSHLSLRLSRVTASGSTGFGGSGVGDTVIIPGNNADCLIGASGGAGNVVDMRVRNSTLTDCANNGITAGSSVANGSGATRSVSLDVADSRVRANHGANLRVGNLSDLDLLDVKVERTDLSDARGTGSSPANVVAEDLGSTRRARIDLGGGPLGSAGGNCLDGGPLAVALVRYDLSARRAWWGTPGGPAPGRTAAAGGSLDSGEPRASDGC